MGEAAGSSNPESLLNLPSDSSQYNHISQLYLHLGAPDPIAASQWADVPVECESHDKRVMLCSGQDQTPKTMAWNLHLVQKA